MRMSALPFPGAGDNRIEISKLRRPAEFVVDLFRRRDEYRSIAGAAGRFDGGQLVAGHFASRIDYLPYAVALPVAQVVRHRAAFVKRLQGEHVGRTEIQDMDVVPDARSVERFVVRAENLDRVALRQRHLEGQRYQMRFRAVRL